jgi:vesicle coat complex subunit
LGGWQQASDEVSLPFYEYAEKILNYAGLSVVEEDATTYDATISIEAKGIPGSASYMGTMGGSHWTKATVEGKISFSAAIAKVLGMPPLISALKDEDGDVRRAAAGALGELKDPRAVEPLISALKDENVSVREAAAASLEEINPKWRETEEAKRKVPEFISALKDENSVVRMVAVWALGELKDPRAVEPLISALKDENRDVRRVAAGALGELKDPRAVEPLISALKDENGSVRRAAAASLLEITGEDFGEDEAKWRDWLGEE